jgi:hypothetical protein
MFDIVVHVLIAISCITIKQTGKFLFGIMNINSIIIWKLHHNDINHTVTVA